VFKLELKLFLVVIGSIISILVIFSSHAADPTFSQNKQDYYLDKINIERSERYLEPVIRKFRSFPHLDKAYRLMDENKYPESKIEFERFFAIDPLDIKQEWLMSSCYIKANNIRM
jgi:hypothetical protein